MQQLLVLTEYYSNHNDSNDAHHDHHLKRVDKVYYFYINGICFLKLILFKEMQASGHGMC